MAFNARGFFERFATAVNARDTETVESMIHPDFMAEIPQSGERSRGIRAFLEQLENYPGGSPEIPLDAELIGGEGRWAMSPGYTVVPLANETEFTLITNARYPDGTLWHIVVILELRDEKLFRMQNFFAPDLAAPLAGSIATYTHG
jgi:hypothetical protein